MMGLGNWNNYSAFGTGFLASYLLIPVMVWSLAWKGWALWRASKNNSKVWFVILLLVNSLGIMDILYVFVFGKQKKSTKK